MDDIFSSFGFNIASSLELRIATKSETEKAYNHKLLTEAFDKLISKIEKGQRDSPTLRQLIMFHIFKSLSELQSDYYEADYEYYKDKPDYPYDGRIPFYRKILAKRLASQSVKEMMKNR